MSEIPLSPVAFFEEYAPKELASVGEALKGRTSPGAVAFELTGAETWSLRLTDGKVGVSRGIAEDTLVRITLSTDDFAPVIVAGAKRLAGDAGFDRGVVAVRVLTLDAERARMLRETKGSLLLRLSSPEGERKLTLTLGGVPPKLDTADAEIACALDDLWAIQSGVKNPFELLMDGKLRLSGNVQLAMALGAALGTT